MSTLPAAQPDFRALFEAVPSPFLVLEPAELRIVAVSDSYLRATMRTREDLLGCTLFEAFPDNPDDDSATGVQNLSASLRRVIEMRQPDVMELQKYDIQRPLEEGGAFEVRYWNPVNSPVLDADGKLQYIIHQVEDATELVRLQEAGAEADRKASELRTRARRMQREIDRRTSELSEWRQANEQLLIAQSQAERGRERELQLQHVQKLESLGILAGGIAHDFNNLLVSILGNAEIAALQIPAGAPALRAIEDIQVAAQRAADLTRQLLAYSGKGKFIIERVDLSQLVSEMAKLVEVSISKKARVEYRFPDQLPAIEADATQIRQVVMNLITNASDALEGRSGTVTISTGTTYCDRSYLAETYLDEDLPEGEYVHIEVTDTGVGMDSDTMARIFDPFFTTKFTGRGLGMAAVLGIVRSHNGAIKVYTERGRGTTIKVLLPPVEIATFAAVEPEAVQGWTGAGSVLIVDDDPNVRTVTARTLELAGITVLTAASGREAVSLYEAAGGGVVAVVLDLTMPDMDGEETFALLRRINPAVRVILTSGYHEQEATATFAGKGLVGFIQKPFRRDDLLSLLRTAIDDNPSP